jgi:hypothetical protein
MTIAAERTVQGTTGLPSSQQPPLVDKLSRVNPESHDRRPFRLVAVLVPCLVEGVVEPTRTLV